MVVFITVTMKVMEEVVVTTTFGLAMTDNRVA
jgi:hypothetical protein